jgi:hypothetical protein
VVARAAVVAERRPPGMTEVDDSAVLDVVVDLVTDEDAAWLAVELPEDPPQAATLRLRVTIAVSGLRLRFMVRLALLERCRSAAIVSAPAQGRHDARW